MTSTRVAVVGAGIAGLSCAYELQKYGFDVTVFEEREFVGGRMSTRTKDGLSFDLGADHLCNLYTDMQAYCRELGLEWKPMKFLQYGVYKQGNIIPLWSAVGWWSRFKILWNQRKARRVQSIFNLSDAAEYDTQSVEKYSDTHFNQEIKDYLIDSFTSTYQFHRADEISSGAFITILDSLRHDGDKWNLHQIVGGMIALPNALAAKLTVRLRTPVTHIQAQANNVEITTHDSKEIFDVVVLACTANVAKTILANPTPAQKDILEHSHYSSTISVAFRLPKNLLPAQSVVWVPFAESQSVSGYTNQLMKGGTFENERDSLVCVWLHEAYAKTLMNKSDKEVFELVKQEFLRVAPWLKDSNLLVPHDLERWTQAMPKFAHGHLQRISEFASHQGENNIFLCGDYMNSLWTEGSLRGGKRLATLIHQRFPSKP